MDQPVQTMATRLRGLGLETMTFEARMSAMNSFIDDLCGLPRSAETTLRYIQKGDALPSQLVEDDFEKRLDAIERRLDDLETPK